jgi:hypothetical protein
MKPGEVKRLCILVIIVLGGPALLRHALPAKANFDPKPIAQLRAAQPDLVLIGDSMLGSRIDIPLLEEKFGGKLRAESIWNGGAASACWYLVLKNYVVASGVRPRLVCIFFRDRLLTTPHFRTGGIFRSNLESVMHEEEPIVQRVLGESAPGRMNVLEQWVTRVYPVNARRENMLEQINHKMFDVVAPSRSSAKALKRQVNKTFDVARMRGEVATESIDVSAQETTTFNPDPNRSFLPHMVEEAARAEIQLCFVRVKRHPDAGDNMPQDDSLRRYIAELGSWLRTRGCALIDDTDDPAFTADMYLEAKDDHIGTWAKARATEIYAAKLQPLVQR